MKTYYDYPTQVMYWDEDVGTYIGGIAYRDEVICAIDGSIMKISDLIESAKDVDMIDFNAIYEYDHWENLTNDLCGGELPDECPFGKVEMF